MICIITKHRFLSEILPQLQKNTSLGTFISFCKEQITYYSNLIDAFTLYQIDCSVLLMDMIDIIDNYRYFISVCISKMEVVDIDILTNR